MTWLFSIRTKLFVLVFTAFVALVTILYWQIGAKSQAVSDSAINRSLTQSSTILDTRISSRFIFIKELANGIARDGRVLPLVAEQASLTLQDLSLEYTAVYDFDLLFFMNAQGDILARADQEDAIGINLAGRSSLFDNALNGQLSTGFIASQGKLMQTVAAPVFDNTAKDLVKGVVVIAYELSRDTAKEIVALTQSQIGFFTFTRNSQGIIDGIEPSYMSDDALSQTKMGYFAQRPQAYKAILESASDDLRLSFLLEDSLQHSVFRRINSKDGNPLGFVVAMRSADELQRPFKEIQQELLTIGAIGIVLASLLALLMAIGISRPIIRLVELTQQIQNGFYPDDPHDELGNKSGKKSGKDEIALLNNALLTMSKSLKEKAQYEAYLAELADEIQSDSTHTLKDVKDFDRTIVQAKDSKDGQTIEQADRTIAQRYRLVSELGTGTMGVVYLAQDIDLDEKVALKVMQKEFFEDIEGLNVKEEIKLARKITHRNIVRTFDFGSSEKEIYITMEYVQGYDLVSLIKKKGALDINIGVAIMKQICSAMIAAHQMGIIHRDLKPGNMIINRQGILKIMDFGLAMQVKAPVLDDDPDGTAAIDQTQKNTPIMGTPRYMAPEQFQVGAVLDERTDIYAMGVIMFTIFNGKPPFSAANFHQLAYKHSHEAVPELTDRLGELPQELRAIIHKAMEKEPVERFQTVREMLGSLDGVACA